MKRLAALFAGLALVVLSTSLLAATAGNKVPQGLLPDWAVPQHYTLDLKVDPRKDDFSGTTTIAVKLAKATDHVWLHGQDLKVDSVRVTAADGKPHSAKWVEADARAGVARIDFGRTLKAGEVTLAIAYSAPFNKQLEGLYKVSRDGRDYAMTQFEPVSARFAFPGFDQPNYKTAFDIRITIPSDQVAAANSAVTHTSEGKDGWKTLTFATTQPLPTYLVAFAIGPWDVIDGKAIAANQWRKQPIPLRGIAPHGEGNRMQPALDQTPGIIEFLENYYAFGYPFGKLDQLAAPDFAAGAMENAGLVTYRDWLMLLDKDSPQRNVQGSFNTAAHELAHQWTGDTVTMKWWDDIWLNEAFATWMQKKVTESIHPEYRADLDRVNGAEGAMSNDSLVSARKIRQPITGNGDIKTAFDGITYQKGAAVLAMFEHYVGDNTFRKGMRAYIQKHKFGNADAGDLVDSIAAAAGKGDSFKQAFNSFLDQSGVPLVSTTLDCSGATPVVRLKQSRYLPLGSSGNTQRTWGIPVCIRTPTGTDCTMLRKPAGTLELSGKTCPAWIMPNADARGYYRFIMSHKDFAALSTVVAGKLSDAEKLAWADAVDSGFRHGDFHADEVLTAMRVLAPSSTADVATAPLGTVSWIWEHELNSDAQRDMVRKQVSEAYLSRLEKLGFDRRAEDTPEDVHLRSRLAGSLAFTFKVPAVRAALRKQGDAVMKGDGKGHLDFAAANPDLAGMALAIVVEDEGKPAVDRLIKALQTTTEPAQRNAILGGLGNAHGDQATRVRNLAIGPSVKIGEMARLFYADRETRAGRDAMWDWFVDHYDAIYKRIGAFASGYVPRLAGGGGCSDEEAERLGTFFKPKLKDLPGADRGLAQTSESIRLCAALKKAQEFKD